MASRILTFHQKGSVGNQTRIGPTYYMEADYTPVAVRLHAENAPTAEAQFDIFADGVSIFNNRAHRRVNQTTGVDETGSAQTVAVLGAGLNSEDHAEDFAGSEIAEGSWVHCDVVSGGGGSNFTVHLELFSPDEPLTEEE